MKTMSELEKVLEEIRKNIFSTDIVNIHAVLCLSPLNKVMLRKDTSGKWKLPGGKTVMELDNSVEMELEMIIDSLKSELMKDAGLSLAELPEASHIVVDASDPTGALFSVMIMINLSNYRNTEERFAEFVKNKELKFFSRQEIIKAEKQPDEFVKRAFRAIIARGPKPRLFFA